MTTLLFSIIIRGLVSHRLPCSSQSRHASRNLLFRRRTLGEKQEIIVRSGVITIRTDSWRHRYVNTVVSTAQEAHIYRVRLLLETCPFTRISLLNRCYVLRAAGATLCARVLDHILAPPHSDLIREKNTNYLCWYQKFSYGLKEINTAPRKVDL